MEIKEKLSTKIFKDGKTYYLYGPDMRDLEIAAGWTQGWNCYLLEKPIEEATKEDVIECVDPIKVWFSDFQIYKHILKKMFGLKFITLSNLRWEFLNSNKNRFQLMYVLVGDFCCYESEYRLICYDTLKSEYIFLEFVYDQKYKIKTFKTDETDKNKIIDSVLQRKYKLNFVEKNNISITRDGVSYDLEHKEYEPLLSLFKFLNRFYFYYIADGDLISTFEPLQLE